MLENDILRFPEGGARAQEPPLRTPLWTFCPGKLGPRNVCKHQIHWLIEFEFTKLISEKGVQVEKGQKQQF